MEGSSILAYLAVSFGVKLGCSYAFGGKKKRLVGKVSDLVIFPIKSTRGVHVTEAECAFAGLQTIGTKFPVRDRTWTVYTASDFMCATLISHPKLSLISIEIENDGLVLSAPAIESIKVPYTIQGGREIEVTVQLDKIKGVDCGDKVARWLDTFFGIEGFRLAYSAPYHPLVGKKKYKDVLGENGGTAFAYSTSTSLMCESSLADLNKRLATPILNDTMRMNIMVDGGDPYEEETWDEVTIGNVRLSVVKLCERCLTVEVDIDAGKRFDKDGPLAVLRKYRPLKKETQFRPVLGIKHMTTEPGRIKIGDEVYVVQ